MKNYATKYHHFLHGADYNPEQWLNYPEILKQDIEYMKEANCNVMSVGIFSWAYSEPEEGIYNFEYLDEIIHNLFENGIKIILATPSGAMPRWMASKYPEVLRVNADLTKNIYGARHNHCYTSPIYRQKAKAIDIELAKRYANNDNIILWHISNEFGGECHCELCQEAFRLWLKDKYNNSLDALNHAWWTGFWSHNVTDWNDIHSPSPLGDNNGVMTGLYMDWKRFVTYQTAEFMKCEIDAVKSINPKIPVTSNFMGAYQSLDYHYMQKFLDVISWDSYPEWHSNRGDEIEAYSIAFQHDLHRCLKNGKPFLLMESTPSLTNWAPVCKLKRPGMHKLSSLQAVAHGSDSVQYFQWRKGRGGVEKFHGAVIDHNGKNDTRVFNDVKEVGEILKKAEEVCASTVKSEVAVVYDFSSRWALENANGFINADKKYKRTCTNHYKEFWKRGINVDVVGVNADFSRYKILILPMLHCISEETVDKIESYVSNGGIVVATYGTAYVNKTDLCYLGGFPAGKLKEVFGITADEIDSLHEGQKNSVTMNLKSYDVIDYCELLSLTTAGILATYNSDFYKDYPALTVNYYNKGKAYYIACRDTGELLYDFYEMLLKDNNIVSYNLPEGVTVHTREDDKAIYAFIENYSGKEQTIEFLEEFSDIESGNTGLHDFDCYDIKILKKSK